MLCAEEFNSDRLALGADGEVSAAHTAGRDAVIFEDLRVLQNLLDLEPVYVPPCNYFVVVQRDIQPYMRKVVSTWMLEVSGLPTPQGMELLSRTDSGSGTSIMEALSNG